LRNGLTYLPAGCLGTSFKATLSSLATQSHSKIAESLSTHTIAFGHTNELYADSDDYFAYVAGYAPGRAPYGVTREELGEKPPWPIEDDLE